MKRKISFNSAMTLILLVSLLSFGLFANITHAALVSILEAVDNFNIAWRNYTDTPWVGETDTASGVFGGDRAHSGVIGNDQSSTLYGYFVGPGWLTFYISVASEPNWDFLSVYLDSLSSIPKFKISGLVHQQGCVIQIPAGTHTVYWQYKKDGSQSWYRDMAWLDLVQYTRATITITSPSAGETWVWNAWHTIKWTYANPYNYGNDRQVQIELWKGNSFARLFTYWTPNGVGSNSYNVYIPQMAAGSDYRIRIWAHDNDNLLYDIEDYSDYFTIKEFYIPPIKIVTKLTVVSPNGDEVWPPGSTHEIKWTQSGIIASSVKIELLKAGVSVGTATASTPNDGSFMWTISASRPPGNDYKIRITSTTSSLSDTSDNSFTIGSGPPPTATLTVTSPNGGENWPHGTTHPVTWTYTGNPGANVKIELLKAGVSVGTATSSTPLGAGGTGSFSWPISATRALGADYKIRVSSTTTSASDTSNNNFAIT